MSASFVSSVYLDIAPMQFKLKNDELWLLQNPEYHAIAQQISKDLKNESNSKIRRHTINIKTGPSASSTPKIISVERKKCSETCEKTCIRRSISIKEAINYPNQVRMDTGCDEADVPETALKTDVKSKINFFNQIASADSTPRFPKAIPRRRLSIRNDFNKTTPQSPKKECHSHVFGKDVRVFQISSEDFATVNQAVQQKNKDWVFPKYGTVKQNKQKFDHSLGSSFSEEKKIKRYSNGVQLPITAVPVKLRIAELEKKCANLY